jgi:hypothetical protein
MVSVSPVLSPGCRGRARARFQAGPATVRARGGGRQQRCHSAAEQRVGMEAVSPQCQSSHVHAAPGFGIVRWCSPHCCWHHSVGRSHDETIATVELRDVGQGSSSQS